MQKILRLIARLIVARHECTYVRHCKENAPIYMYYEAPETPMMSSVIADCPDLAPPNILDKSTPMLGVQVDQCLSWNEHISNVSSKVARSIGCITDIPTIFSKYSATGHLFADDVQAYVHGPPSSQLLLASKIELLSNDLNSWMSSNRLSLNSAKTQLIWFGTPQQLLKLDHALLSDRFPYFTFQTAVRDLGVTLDSALTFSHHISNLTRSSYFQMRRLRAIRKAVSVPIFTSFVHAFVCSRIDYIVILY